MDKLGIHKVEKYTLPSFVGGPGKSHAKSMGVEFCDREAMKNREPQMFIQWPKSPQVAGVGSGPTVGNKLANSLLCSSAGAQ